MKLIKLFLFYLLIAFIGSSIVHFTLIAYSPLDYKVKFNSVDINKTEMYRILHSVEDKYYTDVKIIRFYHLCNHRFQGLYMIGGVILIDTCYDYENTLYHELKHHYCFIYHNDISHEGCFLEPIGIGGSY